MINPAVPTDIIGLRQIVGSYLYPLDIQNLHLIIGFPIGSPTKGRLHCYMAERPDDHFWADYEIDLGDGDGDARMTRQVVMPFSLRLETAVAAIWCEALPRFFRLIL